MLDLKYIYLNILDIDYRRKVVGALILMFIVALIEIINISLIGPYLGILLSGDLDRLNHITDLLNQYLDIINLKLNLNSLSAILLLILVISGALSYFSNWLLSMVGSCLGIE